MASGPSLYDAIFDELRLHFRSSRGDAEFRLVPVGKVPPSCDTLDAKDEVVFVFSVPASTMAAQQENASLV